MDGFAPLAGLHPVAYTEKEKVITYAQPGTPASNVAAAGNPPAASARKSTKALAIPDGHYTGEHVVENAKRFYEDIQLPELRKKYNAVVANENVNQRNKPDVIGLILAKIVLPAWGKKELQAEAEKYGARKTGTKEQLADSIVSKLLSSNLISSKTPRTQSQASPAGSVSPSSSSSTPPAASGAPPSPLTPQLVAPVEASPPSLAQFTTPLQPLSSSGGQVKQVDVKIEKKPRKRMKVDASTSSPQPEKPSTPTGASSQAPAAAAEQAMVPNFDIIAMADQIKRLGSSEPLVTQEEHLSLECRMRMEALELVETLLNTGASSPSSIALLKQQLMPHVLREKAAIGSTWVEKHKRTLARRKLKRKRERTQQRIERSQAEMSDLTKQLNALTDA